MSFNEYSRKVRNPNLPLSKRRSAFGSCLLRFAWLTNQPYADVRQHFAPWFGAYTDYPHTTSEMLAALTTLETERDALLTALYAYQKQRNEEKACGRRFPVRSQVQVLADVLQSRRLSELPY